MKKPKSKFNHISYRFGEIDISLYGAGTKVCVDATGFRNDTLQNVEINIAGTIIVLDGDQATNLLKTLNSALTDEKGKTEMFFDDTKKYTHNILEEI